MLQLGFAQHQLEVARLPERGMPILGADTY
jgi:hypothetical protein